MKTTVIIPKEQYRYLLLHYEPNSDESIWLKNGLIFGVGPFEAVRIVCEDMRAETFMEFTARKHPEVVPYIKLVPRNSH